MLYEYYIILYLYRYIHPYGIVNKLKTDELIFDMSSSMLQAIL